MSVPLSLRYGLSFVFGVRFGHATDRSGGPVRLEERAPHHLALPLLRDVLLIAELGVVDGVGKLLSPFILERSGVEENEIIYNERSNRLYAPSKYTDKNRISHIGVRAVLSMWKIEGFICEVSSVTDKRKVCLIGIIC